MKDRTNFKFQRSYYEVFKELPKSHKLSFIEALLDFQFTATKPLLKGIAKFAWISQKHYLEKQLKGYQTAIKPTAPPMGSDTLIVRTLGAINNKKEERNNKKGITNNIIERKAEFKNSLQPFLEIYGSDLLNEFYLYWTEKKPKGRKMLFEMQKTFEIERRLTRWNNNNFNKKEKSSGKKENAGLILKNIRNGFN